MLHSVTLATSRSSGFVMTAWVRSGGCGSCGQKLDAATSGATAAFPVARENRETMLGARSPAASTPTLPPERRQAAQFRKMRAAHSAALCEDYAELIDDLLQTSGEARVTDIARRLGVSHATVNKNINKMKREGLATARPYRGVFLTDAGNALAARIRARHRLVVDLLLAVGVPLEDAEQDAEGIEHYVSNAALSAFEQFLGMRRKTKAARGPAQKNRRPGMSNA